MSSISISSPADLAKARNFLRKRTAGHSWTPTLRARATATLAALAELAMQLHSSLLLDIHSISRPGSQGIELLCTIPSVDDKPALMNAAKIQLLNVVNEIDYYDDDKRFCIVARLWSA